jgi:hypothetical protein
VFRIIEQIIVTEAIARAYLLYPRVDDLYNALLWRLARDPFPPDAIVVGPDMYLIKSENWEYEGSCVITMIYTVTEDIIFIDEIRFE